MTDSPATREYRIRPLGVVHSSYDTTAEAPHQGFADDEPATLEVFEAYAGALAGVEDLIRVTVLYWAHEADRDRLVGDDGDGVFARRAPDRPNPVSVCTCTVLDVDGRRVRVRGLDAVDGSPLVDLKPALQAER